MYDTKLAKKVPSQAYLIPKDEKTSYYKYILRNTKCGKTVLPGPGHNHKDHDWKVHQKNFGLGPERLTFTDDAAAHSKKIPAPSAYRIKETLTRSKVLLGKMENAGIDDPVNYLSDVQYRAYEVKGFKGYTPNKEFVKPRVTFVKFHPAEAKKDWKPKKTKDPDPGSYDFRKGQIACGKSEMIHRFAAPRGEHQSAKDTFTTISTKRKKFIPGVGSYTPKMDFVAVPYGRKRC